MTRRKEIESIIIGTLLNTFETDWFADCSYCITADMFMEERNAKIYSVICEYRNTGDKVITPIHLFEFDDKLFPLLEYMSNLAVDFYFLVKKIKFNERVRLAKLIEGKQYRYTDVKFSDYVSKFIEMVIKERKTQNKSI